MQAERDEAIAEAHYWKNLAMEMAHQQTDSPAAQYFNFCAHV